MFEAANLKSIRHIRHGFLTRREGVSLRPYDSLNIHLSLGDTLANVLENRKRGLARLGYSQASLCIAQQVHSPIALIVEKPWEHLQAPEADALVTNTPGIVLGISTADCGPVLFADSKKGIIGAAHAGWKGAINGVLENTIQAMESLGASRNHIEVAIGPCIHQPSYEVGPEFYQQFLETSATNGAFFIPSSRPQHFMFDLPGYVETRLKAAGVASISRMPYDTRQEEPLFFSYRRNCLQGIKGHGCQLSAITLT